MSYQQITLLGNLGRDAELRHTPNGTPVANFSMAVSEKWKDRDGNPQERTTWVRVALWNKLAESLSQYLTKGKQVLVVGRLNPDAETGGPRIFTRNDGTAGASYEVTASVVRLCGGRGSAPSQDQDDVPPAEDEDDSDMPF